MISRWYQNDVLFCVHGKEVGFRQTRTQTMRTHTHTHTNTHTHNADAHKQHRQTGMVLSLNGNIV